MLAATKQKTELANPIIGGDTMASGMPDHVQNSLDRILQFYRSKSMRPQVNLSGDPLAITSGLVSQVRGTLPNNLQKDGTVLLDYLIQEIVSFCREKQVRSLYLNFVFENGRIQ